MYTWGLSQNAIFSTWIAYCFPQNIRGLYTSGAALIWKGGQPKGRQCQAEARPEDYAVCKSGKPKLNCEECAKKYPWPEAQYFPMYPCYNPERPMIDCSANYINDYNVMGRSSEAYEYFKRYLELL